MQLGMLGLLRQRGDLMENEELWHRLEVEPPIKGIMEVETVSIDGTYPRDYVLTATNKPPPLTWENWWLLLCVQKETDADAA